MLKLIAGISSALGAIFTLVGTGACAIVWVEEPEMPSNLIK